LSRQVSRERRPDHDEATVRWRCESHPRHAEWRAERATTNCRANSRLVAVLQKLISHGSRPVGQTTARCGGPRHSSCNQRRSVVMNAWVQMAPHYPTIETEGLGLTGMAPEDLAALRGAFGRSNIRVLLRASPIWWVSPSSSLATCSPPPLRTLWSARS